jgi:hypothetical protein
LNTVGTSGMAGISDRVRTWALSKSAQPGAALAYPKAAQTKT